MKLIGEYLDTLKGWGISLAVVTILLVGTIMFHFIEGWNFIDSLYFSAVTLSTIGYGDLAPKTDAGKIFTVLYLFVGIGIIFSFINAVAQRELRRVRRKDKEE